MVGDLSAADARVVVFQEGLGVSMLNLPKACPTPTQLPRRLNRIATDGPEFSHGCPRGGGLPKIGPASRVQWNRSLLASAGFDPRLALRKNPRHHICLQYLVRAKPNSYLTYMCRVNLWKSVVVPNKKRTERQETRVTSLNTPIFQNVIPASRWLPSGLGVFILQPQFDLIH